jgi:predicted ABC-type ATPase
MKLVDYWVIIDNSEFVPELIAESTSNKLLVKNEIKWNFIRGFYGK